MRWLLPGSVGVLSAICLALAGALLHAADCDMGCKEVQWWMNGSTPFYYTALSCPGPTDTTNFYAISPPGGTCKKNGEVIDIWSNTNSAKTAG